MKTTNDRIREMIEDFVCSLPEGRVIHPYAVRRELFRQMSIEPTMSSIRVFLQEMTEGDEPEIAPYYFGQYIKLKVKSNESLTEDSRPYVLK